MSNSAETTRTLVIERVFSHPPEKVWRALTEGPLMAQWLLKNDFEPVAGKKFQFQSEPMPQWDGVIDCEVLMVDPLKRLSYSWNALGLESVVLFTLTPAEGGTHLRMEHSGFRADQQQAYGGAKYGWQRFFDGLERLLDGPMKNPVGTESASSLIDERIRELGDWRGEALARVRRIIHEADPKIIEEWKWMGTPVFSHDGIVCTGETYKQVVKLTFAKGAALSDPSGLFNSSLDGNVRRAIDIREGETIDEVALKKLILAAVALNVESKSKAKPRRAGGKPAD